METELEYWKKGLRRIHTITKNEHIELLNDIILEIKKNNLSQTDLINILRVVDADIATDILNVLIVDEYLTEEEFDEIHDELRDIYVEEYIKDKADGTFKKRVLLKQNRNPRPISKSEIVSVFLKNSHNFRLLWDMDKTEDEFLLGIVADFKELGRIKKTNEIFKKQTENMEQVLNSILTNIKDLRIEVK